MTRQPTIHSALSILNTECPGELAIYIHGVWATNKTADEQTQRLFLSLRKIMNGEPIEYHI
jgi:hypothetical protein